MRVKLLAGLGLGLAVALALASVEVGAQTAAQTAPPPSSALVGLVDDYVKSGKVSGIVVGIGRGDAPPLFLAGGKLAFEDNAPPANADSLWRVYSMTKPITGMAAMMLVEDGKIRLDQPVSDFIPAFKDVRVLDDPAGKTLASHPAKHPITIRNLLTHTAGLGYNIITQGPLLDEYNRLGINPAQLGAAMEPQMRAVRAPSLQAFADRVATLPLIAEPGSKWSYSIGLDVMGRVIEVASGMPFDTFLQKRIFDPLKMQSTWFTVPPSAAGRLATNYYYAGQARLPIDPGATSLWLTPPSFPYGGAGLVSSASDYDRFLHMLLNDGQLDGVRVMKPETVRLAMSDLLPAGTDTSMLHLVTGFAGKIGFGAGGSVYLEDAPGAASKGTYGWAGAAGTLAWVDPVRRVRGVIMVNYMPTEHWPLRSDLNKAFVADMIR